MLWGGGRNEGLEPRGRGGLRAYGPGLSQQKGHKPWPGRRTVALTA